MSARARLAERLGGDDVGTDRHDASCELRRRVAEPRIAAQCKMPAAYAACRRAHTQAVAVFPVERAAVFEDAHPTTPGSGGEAQRVIERMQVTAACVEGAREIAFTRDQRTELFLRHETQARVAEMFAGALDPATQFRDLPRLHRDMHLARYVIARDIVLRDEALHQVETLDRHVPDAPGILAADQGFGLFLARRDIEERLCAAAARCAPADARGFEHDDAIAALRKMQRGRGAGNACAHDAHVAFHLACEWRMRRRRMSCGGVVARDVVSAHSGPRYHAHSSGVTQELNSSSSARFTVA